MAGDERNSTFAREMFLTELATERDRIEQEFLALTESKSQIQRGLDAAGERFRLLLAQAKQADVTQPVLMPDGLLAVMGLETGDGVPTALEIALDAMNAEAQRLAFEQQVVATQLADLAGQSKLLMQRHEHEVRTEGLKVAHSVQIEGIAAIANRITSHAISEASKLSGRSGGQSTKEIRAMSLSELVEAFCDYKESTQDRWDAKTAVMSRQRLALWLRIVGDMPAQAYRAEHNDLYVQKLKRLPSNLNKMPAYRDKSIDEVIALGHPPLSAATVNFNINLVRALLRWASDRDHLTKAPGGLERVSSKEKDHEARDAFTDTDLLAIFDTHAYRQGVHRSTHLHWIPLIGLFTGARVNEIAQLRCDDIRDSGRVPFFAFGKHHKDQRAKNAHSNREVPIHPELVRLGFLRYVGAIRNSGGEWVFPDLTKGRDGHSRKFDREFDSYKEKCGVTDSKKTFHSFRHTFITRLRHAEIDRAIVFQMSGHSVKGNAGDRHYTKPFSLEDCLTRGLAALPFESVTKTILPFTE